MQTIHFSEHTLPPRYTHLHFNAPFFEMKWWCSLFFSDASCSLSFCWALSPLPLPKTQLYYMGGPLGARLVFGWKPNIGSHSSVWNNTVTVCIITTRLSQELLWSLWMIGGSVIVSCLALFERPGNRDDLVPFLVGYIIYNVQYWGDSWQHRPNKWLKSSADTACVVEYFPGGSTNYWTSIESRWWFWPFLVCILTEYM